MPLKIILRLSNKLIARTFEHFIIIRKIVIKKIEKQEYKNALEYKNISDSISLANFLNLSSISSTSLTQSISSPQVNITSLLILPILIFLIYFFKSK